MVALKNSRSNASFWKRIYRTRRILLMAALLFTPMFFLCYSKLSAVEYVKNGKFDFGFAYWSIPSRGEVGNRHWALDEPCLSIEMESKRGFDYDCVKAIQVFTPEIDVRGATVSGLMEAVDVKDESEVLCLSVVLVLKDEAANVRYLKYVLFQRGELASTPTDGVIEVGRGSNLKVQFRQSVADDIKEVWKVGANAWKITSIELRVEFYNTWGDNLHVDAIFDNISLTSKEFQWTYTILGGMSLLTLLIATVFTMESSRVSSCSNR